MNKIILSLSLILTMLLFAFLKGYGEERSRRAEYNASADHSNSDSLSHLDHDKNINESTEAHTGV